MNFSNNKFKSVFDVLSTLFFKDADILLAKNIDKRFYLDFFLNYYDIAERDFFEKIKNLTNVDYINDIPVPKKEDIKDISILKKYCFCPIFNKQKKIIAFISSDPFSLKSKFNIEKDIKLYLSFAKNIMDSISKVECQDSEVKSNVNNEDFLLKILESLILELEKNNISECLFEKHEKCISYSYQDIEGQWKKGEIDTKISENFWSMIKERLNDKKFLLDRKFEIKNLSNDTLILLKWKINNESLKNKYKVAIISSDFQLVEKIRKSLNKNCFFTKHFEKIFDLSNGISFQDEETGIENDVGKNIAYDVMIIDEDIFKLKDQLKLFRELKMDAKNILMGSEKASELMSHLEGLDFYVEKSFEKDFLNEVINVFMRDKNAK